MSKSPDKEKPPVILAESIYLASTMTTREINAARARADKASRNGFHVEAFFGIYHLNLSLMNKLVGQPGNEPEANSLKGYSDLKKKIRKARQGKGRIKGALKQGSLDMAGKWFDDSRIYFKKLRKGLPEETTALVTAGKKVTALLSSALKNNGRKLPGRKSAA